MLWLVISTEVLRSQLFLLSQLGFGVAPLGGISSPSQPCPTHLHVLGVPNSSGILWEPNPLPLPAPQRGYWVPAERAVGAAGSASRVQAGFGHLVPAAVGRGHGHAWEALPGGARSCVSPPRGAGCCRLRPAESAGRCRGGWPRGVLARAGSREWDGWERGCVVCGVCHASGAAWWWR